MHDKDKKTPRDGSLHKQFLLIVTTELYLVEVLAEYLKKIALPTPQNFDAIYVMGAEVLGEKTNPVETHYPVFEVCLSDSHH